MRKKKWNELIIALTVSMVVCGCGKNQETDSVSVGIEVNEEVTEEPEEQEPEYETVTYSVVEMCIRDRLYRAISFNWKSASTRKLNAAAYNNNILPALANHDNKRIGDYTYEDYEDAIRTIRNRRCV